MLEFRILPREDFSHVFSERELGWYNKNHSGALEDIDIFKEGARSQGQPSDFSLFVESDDADILVLPFYLELFEYFGKSHLIRPVVSQICKDNQSKLVVVQWNHDVDFGKKYPDLGNYSNLRVLNFNTSVRSKNDIILPFWNIKTDPLKVRKDYTYGFVGRITHPVRQILLNTLLSIEEPIYVLCSPAVVISALKDHSSFCRFDNLSIEDFRKTVGSCEFSFCPRGEGLSSYRFFECFHLNTIPVLIADEVELPFSDINYEDICVRIPECRVQDRNYIENILKEVDQEEMLSNISKVRERFTLKGAQEEVHRCLSKG